MKYFGNECQLQALLWQVEPALAMYSSPICYLLRLKNCFYVNTVIAILKDEALLTAGNWHPPTETCIQYHYLRAYVSQQQSQSSSDFVIAEVQ